MGRDMRRTNAQQRSADLLKAALYRGVGEARRRFEDENAKGAAVVHANSYLVDQLVRTIYDFAHHPRLSRSPISTTGEPIVSIVATGGYGRGGAVAVFRHRPDVPASARI